MPNGTGQSWWDGNQTRIWRITLLVLIGVLSFLGTRVYDRVLAMPDNYVRLERYSVDQDRVGGQLERIENKLDRLIEKGH